uniref:Large ribosomal subunit protein uL23c n=1 Tax=Scinaia undulata TaxID=1884664 RepID=A0A1G4NXP7_9FLOR|nr:Ribosomal protein L23 [Scinaia undulata]SCW23432.1 Ribosomal protein L23 [Scinaia undulata]
MANNKLTNLIDLINKPILTDKTTRLLEDNQYSFQVQRKAKKEEIKKAIEYLFNVRIIKINTINLPSKKRTVGRFIGKKPSYKKAIVTLDANDKINLFPES